MNREWIASRPQMKKSPLQDYTLCFLDIQNQRSHIRRLSKLPETDEEWTAYNQAIQQSIVLKQVLNEVILGAVDQHLNWE